MADLRAEAEKTRAIIEAVDETLNPVKPRTVGFMFLMFNYNDPDGRSNYASNGVDRAEACKILRETADRIEKNAGFKHEN